MASTHHRHARVAGSPGRRRTRADDARLRSVLPAATIAKMKRCRPVLAICLLGALGCHVSPRDTGSTGDGADPTSEPPPSDHPLELRVLVFTRTAGYRHASIEDAQRLFADLDADEAMTVVTTDDPARFSDAGLASFDVVVFANTTGDVLTEDQQSALQRFVTAGRGFVGIHAAADTEHAWPWYRELVGARFVSHPEIPLEAALRLDDPALADHQTVAHLPTEFRFEDEWYNFDRNPREVATVLLTVDEADFVVPNVPPGPSMGEDHPIAWFRTIDGGRSFYTNLGHRPQTWQDPRFVTHLLEGIRWAAGGGHYMRATLSTVLENPLALAVRPDEGVYFIERTGEVRLWRPDTGAVVDALVLEVDTGYENGLLGIVLDPAFSDNGFVYLYASTPRLTNQPVSGPPGINSLLRYVARPDGTLDPSSATTLLSVPSERRCCHEGGSLAFAADGTLLVSTGDNTNPFESKGAAPLDGRQGRETFDARRTSANPHDLRGKLLRINPDGSIPSGNLFPPGSSAGRPEIFAMGVRNPFRIAADPEHFRVYFGDVGPDASEDSSRGPRGYDEINRVTEPGNYGWPHCIAFELPYANPDAEGTAYDCTSSSPPVLAYDYDTATYAALGTATLADGTFVGRTAIAGTVPSRQRGPFSAPPRHGGQLLTSEWTRDLIGLVTMDELGTLMDVERVYGAERLHRPIDLETSRSGALYLLEYGSSFWGDNADAKLSVIEHGEPDALSPTAWIEASTAFGPAPLRVEFSASSSAAPAGQVLTEYAWDIGLDGTVDGHGPEFSHTFENHGGHAVGLVVRTDRGRTSRPVTVEVVVGNAPPRVRIVSPRRGAQLAVGTAVELVGEAHDPEDGVAACEELAWNVRLIHNTHSHPVWEFEGCTAQFVPDPEDHDPSLDLLSYAIELVYTDHGGPSGEPPLTSRQGLQFELVR